MDYNSCFDIDYAIYKKLGGNKSKDDFDSDYSLLLDILPIINGGSGTDYWTVYPNVYIFPMTYDIYNDVFLDSPEEFISAYIFNCATDKNLVYIDRQGTTVYNVHSNIMENLLPVNASDLNYYQTEWSNYIQEDLTKPDFFIFVSGISPIDNIETLTNDWAMSDSEINWAIDAEKLPTNVVLTRDLETLAPDEFGKAHKTGEIPTPTTKPFRNKKWWRKEKEDGNNTKGNE